MCRGVARLVVAVKAPGRVWSERQQDLEETPKLLIRFQPFDKISSFHFLPPSERVAVTIGSFCGPLDLRVGYLVRVGTYTKTLVQSDSFVRRDAHRAVCD